MADNQIKCPQCGGSVDPGTKFCANCGATIPDQIAKAKQSFCVSCGKSMTPGTTFCPGCGAQMGGVPAGMGAPGGGFFEGLFDISFVGLLRARLLSSAYVIGMVIMILYMLSVIVMAFVADELAGVIVLILSPLVFMIWLIFFRVGMEVAATVYKINENIEKIARQKKV